MQELYKGYIPTKDKVPQKKFKNASDLLTLDEAEKLPEYAGLLADNVVLIDIDDYDQSEKLMNIVEALQLNCRVSELLEVSTFISMVVNRINVAALDVTSVNS